MTITISLISSLSVFLIWLGLKPTNHLESLFSKKVIRKIWEKKEVGLELPRWVYGLSGAVLFYIVLSIFVSYQAGLFSLPFGYFLAVKLPNLIQQWRTNFKKKKLLEEMEGAMMVISATVRGGSTLLDSFSQAAKYVHSPLKEELETVVNQVRYGGLTLSKALELFAKKWDAREVNMLYHATSLATEFGGQEVPEVMRSVANSIREGKQVEEKIKAKTTYQKWSGVIISGVPIGILIIFKLMSPQIFETLVTDAKPFLLIGIVLMVIGWYMVFRILNKIEEF